MPLSLYNIKFLLGLHLITRVRIYWYGNKSKDILVHTKRQLVKVALCLALAINGCLEQKHKYGQEWNDASFSRLSSYQDLETKRAMTDDVCIILSNSSSGLIRRP